MPTDIDALLNNKSIRIFNTEAPDPTGMEYLANSIYERLPGHPEYEEMKYRLQFICDNSETFSNAMATLTPESALWIDLDNDAKMASAKFYDGEYPGIPDLRGFVSIEPLLGDTPFFQLISETGNVIDVSFNRTLIHEVSHAVLNTKDPDQPLNGASDTPLSDYMGSAVVFENLVLNELSDNGVATTGDRLSYSNISLRDTITFTSPDLEGTQPPGSPPLPLAVARASGDN